jgi:mannose-1-phosphate guanylyltransferase/mannose-6-phosphate isomerase
VLAGGAGTRFWPASRRARPKPFVSLLGEGTLLDATLERLYRVAPADRVSVVAPRRLEHVARRALREHPGVGLLIEPVARDTAAAVAWAAASAMAEAPDALLGIFPADHHIPSAAAFARTVRVAERAARRRDKIVLIGIEPGHPETGYGYLRIDGEGLRDAAPVGRFVEKPDLARARRYLRSGRYLWNAGMLVAPAARVLEETRACAPEVWGPLGALLERRAAGRRVARAELERTWRRVRPLSFDVAVLERTRRIEAVRGRFAWSDLGSWDALAQHLRSVAGNRVAGAPPVVSLDSQDNVIWNTSNRALVLLGVRGLVWVETEDAALVCPADRAQDLRRVVQDLARRGRGDLT